MGATLPDRGRRQSAAGRSLRHVWVWLLACAVLLGGVGAASAVLPRQFTVTSVIVVDARPEVAAQVQAMTERFIRQRARLFGRTNIFFVPREGLERELPRAFPVIQTVQVVRLLPGTVRIAVQEKVAVALLYAGGVYYALDPAGIAFEAVPAERLRENTFPVVRDERPHVSVTIGKSVLQPHVLTTLHDLSSLLPSRVGVVVKEVTIPAIGAEELRVLTNEGWELLLDTQRPLPDQLATLEKIFAEELDETERTRLKTLDLRVAGKAFYTFRSGSR